LVAFGREKERRIDEGLIDISEFHAIPTLFSFHQRTTKY